MERAEFNRAWHVRAKVVEPCADPKGDAVTQILADFSASSVKSGNYLPIDEEWSAYCSRRQKYPQISQISPIFFSNLRTLRNLRMISNGG